VALVDRDGRRFVEAAAELGAVGLPADVRLERDVEAAVADGVAALGGLNVVVNAVVPGFVETPLVEPVTRDEEWLANVLSTVPLGRAGRADEVAGADRVRRLGRVRVRDRRGLRARRRHDGLTRWMHWHTSTPLPLRLRKGV
jgi:NAD(P)-dependent dehydrogenase (short-subunit alcohol dehydrogenase family)